MLSVDMAPKRGWLGHIRAAGRARRGGSTDHAGTGHCGIAGGENNRAGSLWGKESRPDRLRSPVLRQAVLRQDGSQAIDRLAMKFYSRSLAAQGGLPVAETEMDRSGSLVRGQQMLQFSQTGAVEKAAKQATGQLLYMVHEPLPAKEGVSPFWVYSSKVPG
ncbi:MAG: hypothetical protein V3R99_12925 [Thermoguttaceae bacterium]